MRTDIDINHFKDKLEAELKEVSDELAHVGRKNPGVSNEETDWEATPGDSDADAADDIETADKIEEFEENTAVVKNLEIRYNQVKHALQKIEDGKYGICEIGGEEIEKDRLEANPSAITCKVHMNE